MHAFRAKVSREGRRQSWLASCKRFGGDSGEFLCPTKQRSARKRRLVGHERWLRDAAVLVITLSQEQPCRIATGVCMTRDQLRLVLQPDDQLVKIKIDRD